jgi:hypothetical protein
MKRFLFAVLLVAAPAHAQAPAGSNINLSQYPASTCVKPAPVDPAAKPVPPQDRLNDLQAIAFNKKVDAYNAQMRAYNEQSVAYGNCINTYIANGNADMRRIRDALDAALAGTK